MGVRVPDIRYRDKDFKRILFIWLAETTLYISFNLFLTFLSMSTATTNSIIELGIENYKGTYVVKPRSFL